MVQPAITSGGIPCGAGVATQLRRSRHNQALRLGMPSDRIATRQQAFGAPLHSQAAASSEEDLLWSHGIFLDVAALAQKNPTQKEFVWHPQSIQTHLEGQLHIDGSCYDQTAGFMPEAHCASAAASAACFNNAGRCLALVSAPLVALIEDSDAAELFALILAFIFAVGPIIVPTESEWLVRSFYENTLAQDQQSIHARLWRRLRFLSFGLRGGPNHIAVGYGSRHSQRRCDG